MWIIMDIKEYHKRLREIRTIESATAKGQGFETMEKFSSSVLKGNKDDEFANMIIELSKELCEKANTKWTPEIAYLAANDYHSEMVHRVMRQILRNQEKEELKKREEIKEVLKDAREGKEPYTAGEQYADYRKKDDDEAER